METLLLIGLVLICLVLALALFAAGAWGWLPGAACVYAAYCFVRAIFASGP